MRYTVLYFIGENLSSNLTEMQFALLQKMWLTCGSTKVYIYISEANQMSVKVLLMTSELKQQIEVKTGHDSYHIFPYLSPVHDISG